MNWYILWSKLQEVIKKTSLGEAEGTYELLKSDTLSESVKIISVDIPACVRILFKAKVSASEIASNVGCALVFDDGSDALLGTIGGVSNSVASWTIEVFRQNGYYALRGYSPNRYETLMAQGYNTPYNFANTIPSNKALTQLVLSTTGSSSVFPAGTTFEIWGVRK